MKRWLGALLFALALLLAYFLGSVGPDYVTAAPSADAASNASEAVGSVSKAGSIVMCVKTATTGPIDFYYCETDFGNFFANSAGFMALED